MTTARSIPPYFLKVSLQTMLAGLIVLLVGTGSAVLSNPLWANPISSSSITSSIPDTYAQNQTPPNSPPLPQTRPNTINVAQRSISTSFGFSNLFIIFFITLGPLKILPTFLKLTHHATGKEKRQLAVQSAAIAAVIILLVVLVGEKVMEGWQIRLPALMIAGGILLSVVAARLVLSVDHPIQVPEDLTPKPWSHLAVSPMAFPKIVPPFGIAIALTMMLVAPQIGLSKGIVIGTLLAVMALNCVFMIFAEQIIKLIRPVTLKILGFTLGVMQFALGIELIMTGIEAQAIVLKLILQNE
ncbi:MAG: MarC family protein [Cyanobacteria bacterium P01_H01_bin.15]